jgi:hypothetical protein
VDAAGLVARRCDGCRRRFKTSPWAEDEETLGRVVAALFRPRDPIDAPLVPVARTCPYCGITAPPESFLTPSQRDGLETLARRFLDHARFAQLKQLFDDPRFHASPTCIPVAPAQLGDPWPGEPITRTAPVPLVCCPETLEIQVKFNGAVHCPSCGIRNRRRAEVPPFELNPLVE